ncbi:hypothetical protein FNYG_10487 [Fusarium nygamai]|uniref:Uncharacterized protein n=1 Tax=Gibberella nygamai TaxID=42673 RepID=A0A2K0W1P4_GIBNY|nr:hypothetical protein FNYG_10487 [Fusarium nygamai]
MDPGERILKRKNGASTWNRLTLDTDKAEENVSKRHSKIVKGPPLQVITPLKERALVTISTRSSSSVSYNPSSQ